jgi:hypothetical protein
MTNSTERAGLLLAMCGALGLVSPLAGADCWSDLPSDATRGLRISLDALPFPNDGECKSLVPADFNGDGQTDYALLVNSAGAVPESALMLVAKAEQWTLTIVRRWSGSGSPTTLRLLPPGRYLRAGSILEPLGYGEVPTFVAKRVGLQAGSWAYFWHGDRWVSVRLAK